MQGRILPEQQTTGSQVPTANVALSIHVVFADCTMDTRCSLLYFHFRVLLTKKSINMLLTGMLTFILQVNFVSNP